MKKRVWTAVSLLMLTAVVCTLFFFIIDKKRDSEKTVINSTVDRLVNTAKTSNYIGTPFINQKQTEAAKEYFSSYPFSGAFEVVKNNQTVTRAANGYADSNYYSNVNSLYNIGSFQFQFNSALILKMVQSGKLSLNDSISKIIPEMKEFNNVSIRNILLNKNKIGLDKSLIQNNSYDEIIKRVDSSDNKRYTVKNDVTQSNSVLMGLIIQNVSSRQYEQVLQSELLTSIPALNYVVKSNSSSLDQKSVAISYQYRMVKTNLDYSKSISQKKDYTIGANQIYMSVTDTYNSLAYLLRSNYLNSSNKLLLKKGMLATNTSMKNNGYFATTAYNGFVSALYLSQNGENGVIMLLNANPGKDDINSGMNYFIKKYNLIK